MKRTTAEMHEQFDQLAPVRIEEILGRWRGAEIDTGHPLNGRLAELGWYGKDFIDAETIHPLLFEDKSGKIFIVDPKKLPTNLATQVPKSVGVAGGKMFSSLIEPLFGTSKPRARLRHLEHRGKVSAAMIYDHLPIIDVFRRLDGNTLLGVMDQRGDEPFFFTLQRA